MTRKILFFILSLNSFLLSSPLLTEIVAGKPNMRFFEVKKTVTREWGINYEVSFVGCILTDKVKDKLKKSTMENIEAKAFYSEKLGTDWEQRLNAEVMKRVTGKHRGK